MKALFCLSVVLCLFYAPSEAQLKADFTASVRSGCIPVIVQFQDRSTGNPTSWFWDLGNGTTSTVKNPQIIYTTAGNYTIKLIVGNGSEKDSVVYTDYISVYENPVIDFDASPNSGCSPLNVQFTDHSSAGSGTVTERVWDFGDGSISSDLNPQHIYNLSGIFDVTLTLTNSYGCKQSVQKDSVVQIPPAAKAGFDYSFESSCAVTSPVNFKNTSDSVSTSTFLWTFGDGTTSAEVNPTHTYTTPGTYTVQLLAKNSSGCSDTVSQSIFIGSVKTDFNLPDSFCANTPITITNTSNPVPQSVLWIFSDGGRDTAINPVHTFAAAGTYTVKMQATYANCTDTITKTVTVAEKAVPSFQISGNVKSCASPQTATFTNTTTGATGYTWLFGDGTTSSEPNPVHTYTDTGSYSVTLIAYNANGCSDTLVMPDAIQLGPPKIKGFIGLPSEGCAPQTINPKGDIYSPEKIVSYLWNFGDSTTATDSVPSHTYSNTGSYTVTLTVTTVSGCTNTFTLPKAVAVGTHSAPSFTATPLEVCGSKEIQFAAQSTGKINNWHWFFGDKQSGTGQNVTHRYYDTGYFTVTLVTSNSGCKDSIVKTNYIHINPPVALFGEKVNCNNTFSYNFLDSSIQAESWKWNFGDGASSTEQNPVHTYTAEGTFNVSLIVTNGACTDTAVRSVTVVNEIPVLTYNLPEKLCKYDSVSFQINNYKPEVIQSFLWNFGDGSKSSSLTQNLSHKYIKQGVYNPSLIVTYVNGCLDTLTNNVAVQVNGPTANFSSTAGTCISGIINFSDLSTTDGTHPITQWIWNYGDTADIAYTAPPFSHQYLKEGIYDVKLSVYDSYGCKDSIQKDSFITITKPVADFSVVDSIRCTSSDVNFKNLSKGLALQYAWSFGDGGVSSDSTPSHLYVNEGTYPVSLHITDKFGCKDSITKTNLFKIANPVAAFSLSDTFGICPPLLVQATNLSKNYASLSWNFDDGNTSALANPIHYYNQGGRFNLTLIAKGYGECYDTANRVVLLKGPSGNFSYTPFNGCNPSTITLTATAKNAVKFSWDFANGVVLSGTDSILKYTYTAPGIYKPKLVLSDSSGCDVPILTTDSVIIADVTAGIKSSIQIGCDSSFIQLSDSSVIYYDTANSYQWDFGNGITSTETNPSVYFTKPGTYNATHIVTTSAGCTDTAKTVLYVGINPSPKIVITSNDSSCVATDMNFKADYIPDSLNRTDLMWKWNFGDGDTSSQKIIQHSYPASGSYNVTLTGTDANGCSGIAAKLVEVIPPPVVNAGSDTVICSGAVATLNATGANIYNWMDSPALSCTSCSTALAKPDSSQMFYVTGSGTYGCKATDSVFVEVKQPVHLSQFSTDTICAGESVQLNATGAETYNWQPATGLSNNMIANPVATPTTTTTYTLTGSDSKGCFSDTSTITIQVYPIPQFNIIDSVITVNLGSKDTLRTESSPDITKWVWAPSMGLSCIDCAQPVAQPPSAVTYIASASNDGGCTATDQITVNVLCNGSNIFMPNTFSPNNDGMNDIFYPRGNGPLSIRGMRIFNRWGQLLFERTHFDPNDPSKGWDGKYNGQDVPQGVYVYVLDLICDNTTVYPLKGNVTLVR